MVIKQRLKQPLHLNGTSTEHKFLGDSLSKARHHRISGNSMTTHVRNVSVPTGLPVRRSWCWRPIRALRSTHDPDAVCTINGHPLAFPQQFMGSLDKVQCWLVLMMPVPLEFLQLTTLLNAPLCKPTSTRQFQFKPGISASPGDPNTQLQRLICRSWYTLI